jgi:hypothetical protein
MASVAAPAVGHGGIEPGHDDAGNQHSFDTPRPYRYKSARVGGRPLGPRRRLEARV